MNPEIAIIDNNTLACLGLEGLLQEIIPQATIRLFPTFEAFMDDTPDMYAHYFVSAQIYFEHTAFFLDRRQRCIVLTAGMPQTALSGVATLNICQDEQHIAKSIVMLRSMGHPSHPAKMHGKKEEQPPTEQALLSAREQEVLVLLVRGLINKEIADRLCISLTTVITHRKNITEKLGIKSLSGLTIYAIMQGLVEVDSI